jgi:hypothetical protein
MTADTPQDGRRTYFTSFESAMSDFDLAVANTPLAREIAARVPHSAIYIPTQSRQYIALMDPEGKRMSVAINKGYAWVRPDVAPTLEGIATEDAGWWGVDFPENSLRVGGGTRKRENARARPVCDLCWSVLPATGICDCWE